MQGAPKLPANLLRKEVHSFAGTYNIIFLYFIKITETIFRIIVTLASRDDPEGARAEDRENEDRRGRKMWIYEPEDILTIFSVQK